VKFIIEVQKFDGHKKLWGHAKFGSILHNFRLGRFYTTSDFDREYLQNESRYQKS